MSWAAAQGQEMIVAIHSYRKIRSRKADQVEEVRRSPRRHMDHRIVVANELLLIFFLKLEILSIGAVTEASYSRLLCSWRGGMWQNLCDGTPSPLKTSMPVLAILSRSTNRLSADSHLADRSELAGLRSYFTLVYGDGAEKTSLLADCHWPSCASCLAEGRNLQE